MKKLKGFTLIELLIAVSILSILLGVGIPSLGSQIEKSQVKTLKKVITRSLGFARSHSVNTGKVVTLCGIDKDKECIKDNFNILIVFIDANENKAIDDDDEVLLQTDLSYSGELTLSASLGRKYIQFDHSGAAKQAGSFTYCSPKRSIHAARITVSMSGRYYMGADSDGDGIVEGTDGENIFC